jgi:hypothetical protein
MLTKKSNLVNKILSSFLTNVNKKVKLGKVIKDNAKVSNHVAISSERNVEKYSFFKFLFCLTFFLKLLETT